MVDPVKPAPGPLVVGLTGGIASGKSTVAGIFSELGAPVLDTDEIARDLVAPGTFGLERVAAEFGGEVLSGDGTLDRAALRRIVFADPDRRGRLERLLHPLIMVALRERSAAAGGAYQLHVIPLLAEKGLAGAVDRVLVVDCPEEVQRQRLIRRDEESAESADRMLAAQSGRADRLAIADDVLVNAGPVEALRPAVARLHDFYRELAAAGTPYGPGLRLP